MKLFNEIKSITSPTLYFHIFILLRVWIPNKTLSNVFDDTMIHFEYNSLTLIFIVCSHDQ